MSKEEEKSPTDKLLDDLSTALESTNKRQQKLTTCIKVLTHLKNNPIDAFGDDLSKEYQQACMDKCQQILNDK